MKILHIDPDDIDNPLSGGGPVRTYEIYKRLAKRHEITVLTPTFPGSTPELVRDGIRYIRLGRKIRNHGSSHHITFFFSFPQALKNYDYDLLVEDSMPPACVTLSPFFNRKKPLIASMQWFHTRVLCKQYKLPFWLVEKYGIKLYKNFIVLTDAMQTQIGSMNKHANIEVIPNAVDQRLYGVDTGFGDYILYIGRISMEDKGLDLMLKAYALIPESERLPLVIAGDGFQWDEFNRLAQSLNLSHWIKPVGKVDAVRRAELFANCRFACAPSRVETFCMVILEACAAAKPVALFDTWPMNEVAHPTACEKAPPFDIKAYASAMRRLLTDDDNQMLARGRDCRQWALRYNWDAIALQQEQFYESVVARERSYP